MKRLRYLTATVGILVVDLVSKEIAFDRLLEKGLQEGQPEWILGKWFALALVKNRGVTGGMGSGLNPWIITVLTFAAVVGIFLYLLRAKELTRSGGTGLALILGGAAGNLYDRLRYEYVRDFIDVWPRLTSSSWLHHWPTFNVADAAIVVGVCTLLLFSFIDAGRQRRRKRSPAVE